MTPMATHKSTAGSGDVGDVLDFLDLQSVVAIPEQCDKHQVLEFMVGELARQGRLAPQTVPGIVRTLQDRERLGTTGLGHGLALPHLRSHDVSEFLGLVGVAPGGVDFESLDGWPVRIVILVVSPFDQPQRHFDILGRLATLFSDKTLQYSAQLPRSPELILRFLGVQTRRIDL
jgi:PTS system nitrogen regulatory IIA component